jgi:hypothetical protein
MSGTYTDIRWAGGLADITAALAPQGWAVNADGAVVQTGTSTIDDVVGGRIFTLDGTSYVTMRATAPLAMPANLTDPGVEHAAALTGVFMSDAPPTAISSSAFFQRFTDAERGAIWAAAVGSPAIGSGLVGGLSAGTIDLTSVAVKTWLDACVTAGALTAQREAILLTP